MGTPKAPRSDQARPAPWAPTFVARSLDRDTKHLEATLATAAKHKGASFVEVFQNCNIYNDGAFASFADKDVRQDRMVYLEDGKPLRYGKHLEHGIRLNGFQPEAVENPMSDDELLVHDTGRDDIALPMILSGMDYPDFPVPLGVFRQIERETYDGLVAEQVDVARDRAEPDLEALIAGPETWNVL